VRESLRLDSPLCQTFAASHHCVDVYFQIEVDVEHPFKGLWTPHSRD
jgi:hypothetical protein